MTDSAYPVLTQAENAFKTIVWDPLVQAGELALDGAAPFFALPIISELDGVAIKALTDVLYQQFIAWVDVASIVLVKDVQQAIWAEASEKLAILAIDSGENSDAYKKALAAYAVAFSNLVRTGG